MNFDRLFQEAKNGSRQAQEEILAQYKPLLVKESIVDGMFDEDLFQELCMTLLHCIDLF